MKIYGYVALIAFIITGLNAQEGRIPVNAGDVFTISPPSSAGFQHVYFPRKNSIIKRGAVPNMKSVYGVKVVVTSFSHDETGRTRVTLERQDGRKFFRHFRSVEAHLGPALRSGELRQ